MPRRRTRDMARTPGFRYPPRIALDAPHVDDYDGTRYETPSIIGQEDGNDDMDTTT